MTDLPFPGAPFVLPFWLRDLSTPVVGVLSTEGRVIEGNRGFLALTGGAPGADAALVIEPAFGDLLACVPGKDGAVYAGQLTLGANGGLRRSFLGRVYRHEQTLLVVAEPDNVPVQQTSTAVARLTRELDETKRLLTRRNYALQKALDDLKRAREADALTGLALRPQFDARMNEEIERWERYRRPLAVAILDIDEFGKVNETYGRTVGDEILSYVATVVKQAVRTLDLPVRYGGQEFAVMLPETNEMGAVIVAERLRMELEEQIMLPLVKPVTASFGVAALMPGEKLGEICGRAERAVRNSKANGKNCVTVAGVIAECDYLHRGMQSDDAKASDAQDD